MDQLIVGGFLTHELAPNIEAKEALFRRQKNIFIFHDESTFNANVDELRLSSYSPKEQGIYNPADPTTCLLDCELDCEHELLRITG